MVLIGERSPKPLVWIGASRRELQGFSPEAREAAGKELDRVQLAREPRDWKPMAGIGAGAREIRVRTFEGGALEHRVVYVAKFAEAVYVLHAFEKKTRKTPPHYLELAAKRYKQMVRERGYRKEAP
jgi:phage-related protein